MDAKATNNPEVIDKFLSQGRQTCLTYETITHLPTPNTMDSLPPRSDEARERQLRRGGSTSRRTTSGNLREDILQVLPTPKARDSQAEGYEAGLRRATPQVGTIVKGLVDGDSRVLQKGKLLATPTASQGEGGALGEEEARRRGNTVGIRDQAMDLAALNQEKISRLPTPTVSDSRGAAKSEVENGNPKGRLKVEVELMPGETINWGKFEPAIRRWEEVLNRDAPSPTKPDGKESAHRLSSAFTEWLMGLPEGWVTDVGLTRNEELKACGNGVVPQQAATALRALLHGLPIASGGGASELPNSDR
jgi:hypothetical protein